MSVENMTTKHPRFLEKSQCHNKLRPSSQQHKIDPEDEDEPQHLTIEDKEEMYAECQELYAKITSMCNWIWKGKEVTGAFHPQ